MSIFSLSVYVSFKSDSFGTFSHSLDGLFYYIIKGKSKHTASFFDNFSVNSSSKAMGFKFFLYTFYLNVHYAFRRSHKTGCRNKTCELVNSI